MNTPEKLGLWDRFFNRHRKEIIEEGQESWVRYEAFDYAKRFPLHYTRRFVKYKIIDRLTGSETIKKEYI